SASTPAAGAAVGVAGAARVAAALGPAARVAAGPPVTAHPRRCAAGVAAGPPEIALAAHPWGRAAGVTTGPAETAGAAHARGPAAVLAPEAVGHALPVPRAAHARHATGARGAGHLGAAVARLALRPQHLIDGQEAIVVAVHLQE